MTTPRAAFNRLYRDGVWHSDESQRISPLVRNILDARKAVAS